MRNDVLDIERENMPDLLDVRLNAIESELQTYCRATPKVGSYVICGIIENGEEAILLQNSEVEKVEIKFNKNSFYDK